jgi:hypothetical protein
MQEGAVRGIVNTPKKASLHVNLEFLGKTELQIACKEVPYMALKRFDIS